MWQRNKPKTELPTNDHASGVHVSGIPELKDTNARRRAEHDKAEIEKILRFLNVDSNIEDCRRIGTYNENKDRRIIVKLSNDWNRKLLLLSLGKLWNYDKKVYLSRELSKEEQLLENDLPNNRQEKIESGIPRKKVRVHNLKLLHYDDQSNTCDEAALDTGCWLNTNENRTVQITLLTFNVHSILDLQRRFTLANAILTRKYDVLCLIETWLPKSVPNESLFLNNLQILRNDRKPTENVFKHGGVLIVVRRDIKAKQLALDQTFEDAIAVLLTDKTKAQKLLISCIENPPKISPYRWPPEKCAQFLTSLKTKRKQLKVPSSLITGDFNFVHTSWGSMQSTDEYENTATDQLANLNNEQKFYFQCILGSKPQLDVFLID